MMNDFLTPDLLPSPFFSSLRWDKNIFWLASRRFVAHVGQMGRFTRVEPRSVLTIMETALFVYELVMRQRQRSCRTDSASGRRRETDWTVWLPQLLLDRRSLPALPARRLASVPVCFFTNLFAHEQGGHIGENALLPWIQTRTQFHGPNPVPDWEIWTSVTTKRLHTNERFSECQSVSL